MHTCMHACLHACMHAYIHTYRQAGRQADRQTYRHTDIQTYIHTDIQTYIHTYKQATLSHACLSYAPVTILCLFPAFCHSVWFRLHLSFVTYWKKLTCGVVRSFNFALVPQEFDDGPSFFPFKWPIHSGQTYPVVKYGQTTNWVNQIRSQSWLVKYDILATHSRRPRTSSICTSRPCWIRLARNYWGAPPCELPSCLTGTQPLSAHRGGGNPGCHKPPIVDEFAIFALTTVNLETINVYAAAWMECAISGKA